MGKKLKFTITETKDFVDLFGQLFKLTDKEKEVTTALIEAKFKYPFAYNLETEDFIYHPGTRKEVKEYVMEKLDLSPKALSGYLSKLKAKNAMNNKNALHPIFQEEAEIKIEWKITTLEKNQSTESVSILGSEEVM